jgi:hypothetical protein
MVHLKQFGKRAMALIFATSLAVPASAAWAHMSPQPGLENGDTMDMNLTRQISDAWSEGKDASGAVAFQENGEIALSSGDTQQAKRDFEAAERELGRLHPTRVSAQSTVSAPADE